MKYVFLVHSHTIFLCSLGTIDYLHIKTDDVIFVCTRNYGSNFFPKGCKVVRAEELYDICTEAYDCHDKKVIKQKLGYVDSAIDEITRGKYELFVPHLSDPLFQIMYTHPKCISVSYVQEGVIGLPDNYFLNKLSLRKKWKRKYDLYKRYGNVRFYCYLQYWYTDGVIKNRNRLRAYAVNNAYFQNLPCEYHIISWPKVNIDLPDRMDGSVFIFDGFVKNGMADSDYYMSQCSLLIKRFHSDYNYIKFHPAQDPEERDEIRNFFKSNNIEYKELDDGFPFELYILAVKDMTIVGFGSSLQHLAKLLGHKVICCDTWMMEDEKYNSVHERGYKFFHEIYDEKEIRKE